MKEGEIAFWAYDLFPFVLGGTITKTHGNTNVVTIREYQMRFSPRHVEPSAVKGRDQLKALDELQREYQRAQSALRHEYMSRAMNVAPFLRRFPAYSDFLPRRKS